MQRILMLSPLHTQRIFRDLLEDPELEAVALAVETSAHFQLAKEALLAGKNVYVEKPFTDSVEQAVILRGPCKGKESQDPC